MSDRFEHDDHRWDLNLRHREKDRVKMSIPPRFAKVGGLTPREGVASFVSTEVGQ